MSSKIELKDHPTKIKNPLTGKEVPAFPNERSIWMTTEAGDTMLIGYCRIEKDMPINIVAPPSVLPKQFVEDVAGIVKQLRSEITETDPKEDNGQFSQVPDPPEDDEEEGDEE